MLKKILETLITFVKGLLFGISNLIPGLSGGTMAVITGVYEKLIGSINSIFKTFKKSMLFLIPYALGIAVSILLGSKGVDYCLKHFSIPTLCLFIGLVLGGMPTLCDPIKHDIKFSNILFCLLAFFIVLLLMILPTEASTSTNLVTKDYIMLFICGFIGSMAMVVPGVSGIMVFMLFGYEKLLYDTLANLTNLSLLLDNLYVLLPIFLGIVIGVLLAAKIFETLLKKYPKQCYFMIIGFVLASLVCMVYNSFDRTENGYVFKYTLDYIQIIIGVCLAILGAVLTYFLSKINKRKQKEIDQNEIKA